MGFGAERRTLTGPPGTAMRTLTLCLLAALATSAQAQDYFPLGDDDVWEYGYVLFPPPSFEPDTMRFAPARVSARPVVNDTAYAVVNFLYVPDTVRVEDGRIYGRQQGRDVLFLDLDEPAGGPRPTDWAWGADTLYTLEIERPDTVRVGAGRFRDVRVFHFEAQGVSDASYYYAFAPGIGLLYSGGGLGNYAELFSAQIDGRFVTNAEGSPGLEVAAFAYPNPSRAGVTVALPAGRWDRAVVLDVLGRRVAVLEVGPCAAGCEVRWDGRAPAGRYVVRLEGERVLAVPVTIGR